MRERKRIAFIITGLGVGGAELMLERLVRRLSPAFEPVVISLSEVGVIGARLKDAGIEVCSLGMHPGQPSPWCWLRLVRMLQTLKPAVVHTWMYHADLMGGTAARAAGIRGVMWGIRHTDLVRGCNKASTRWVARACALLSRVVPARIACVAEAARKSHVALGYDGSRFVVIPNGFDLEQFRPDPQARRDVRTEFGLPPSATLVGMIGRFDPQKNHRGFAQAAALLLARRPEVRFVLAGSGIEGDNLELTGWLRNAGVLDHCHLLGRRDDVARLMASLDLVVSPSHDEAFSNVLGEAQACGVPCAATDVGDSADIVGAHGEVVMAGDMVALAVAMANILAWPDEQRTERSALMVEDMRRRFALQQIVGRYEAVYRTLAKISETA